MNQRRLLVTQSRRHIPRHPKVRILVNRTRDQTRHILLLPSLLPPPPQHHRETRHKTRRGLHGGKGNLPTRVRFRETKNATGLVEGDQFLNFQNGRVQMPDVVEVGEDEGLLGVESARDDVLGVLVGEPVAFLQRQALLEL